MSHALESKLVPETAPTPTNQYSRGDRIKAVIGTGLGVGGCLGFTIAFAAYGSLPAAAAMFSCYRIRSICQ